MDAWVPLLQTLSWIILIAVGLMTFRARLAALVDVIRIRVEKGASFKASVGGVNLEIEDRYQDLPNAKDVAASDATEEPITFETLGPAVPTDPGAAPSWTQVRKEYKLRFRGLHLVHVVAPSRRGDDWLDVFVFLKGHKRPDQGLPADLSDVTKAEFYLGPYWGDKIFQVDNLGVGKRIGLQTEAYGPALCLCRVHFKTGEPVVLSRYLDFEMADILAGRPALERT